MKIDIIIDENTNLENLNKYLKERYPKKYNGSLLIERPGKDGSGICHYSKLKSGDKILKVVKDTRGPHMSLEKQNIQIDITIDANTNLEKLNEEFKEKYPEEYDGHFLIERKNHILPVALKHYSQLKIGDILCEIRKEVKNDS